MNELDKYVIIVIMITFLAACKYNTNNKFISNQISKKNYYTLAYDDTLEGNSFKLQNSLKPRKIDVCDSFIIVINEETINNKLITIYNKFNNKLIKSLGKKGKGPGELLLPVFISINKQEKTFFVQDGPKMKIYVYPIDSALYKDSFIPDKDKFNISIPLQFSYGIFKVNNETYITASLKKEEHFVFFKNNQIIKKVGQYPVIKSIEDKVKNSSNPKSYGIIFQGDYSINPEKINIVHAPMNFNLLYMYNKYGEKKFIVQINQSKTSKKYAFRAVHTTKNRIYALYSGKEIKPNNFSGNTLYIFDWNGKLLKTFYLDIDLKDFCIDKNESKLFGINHNFENNLIIYNLPKI